MSTNLRVTTRTGSGSSTTVEYKHADHKTEIENGTAMLVITHREAPDKPRLLSKVPLANIVQTLETLPIAS